MSKIAGTYVSGSTGDGGPAGSATLTNVPDIAFDPSGNLYILQFGSPGDKVRIVDRNTKIINTYVSSTGVRGSSGTNGPALVGTIDGAESLAVDRFGRLYINAYTGDNVRAVSLNTLFPWTSVGSTRGSQNVIVQASNALTLQSATITPSTSNEFSYGTLSGCSVGGSIAASAYCTFPITFNPSLPGLRTAQLRLVDSDAIQTTIGLQGYGMAPATRFSSSPIGTIAGNGTAGNSGMIGPASGAQVNSPRGGVVDSAGNLYFADSGNNVIRKIDTMGSMTTVAGNGAQGYGGDGGLAVAAQLKTPTNVVVDPAGNLYIADSGNNSIRMVDANSGIISTVAGNGTAGYTGDTGDATSATLNNPQGLALQPDGTLYVADTGNNVVRKFFPRTGYISTVAGTGVAGYSGDEAYPTFATLNAPSAVVIDNSGNLYIADTGNDVVRMVAPFGQITTFAGKHGATTNAGDGGPASSASLISPSDVALDAAGDIYIASGGEVRMVNTAGVISTVVGSSDTGTYSGDSSVATNAVLPAPMNIMVGTAGDLYVSSTAGNRILFVNAANPGLFDLGIQAPNSTGSPQTVTLLNTGNTPLTFSSIAVSANYVLQSTDPNTCIIGTSVAPGQVCTLNISFSPTTLGILTGSIVLTDNALNTTGATQTINLTGNSKLINATTTTVTLSSSSPVYGATPTATATIAGGTGTTGNIVFSVNGSTIGTIPVSGSSASIPIAGLQVGSSTIVAAYPGDNNNASSSGNLTVLVQPAPLTVTATSMARPTGTPNPAFTYTITGFVNGDTAASISGNPVLTSTATQGVPAGMYPIVVTQGTLAIANYTFVLVNGTLTVTAGGPAYGYTLAPVVPVLKVRPIEAAVESLTLTPVGGYTGNVSLTCSGAPAMYSCTFSRASVPMNGTIVQTTLVTLSKNVQASLPDSRAFPAGQALSGIAMIALTFPFGWVWSRKGHNSRLGNLALWAVMSALVGVFTAGCGQAAAPGSGTYTITISATDDTVPPIVQTASFEVDIAN